MTRASLSRRGFLRSLGAVFVGFPLGRVVARRTRREPGTDDAGVLAGRVLSVGQGSLILDLGDEVVPVELPASSKVSPGYRETDGTKLSAFAPGDEVVVDFQGRTDEAVKATSIVMMYRPFQGRVVGRSGNVLRTTSGEVSLDAGSVGRGDGRGYRAARPAEIRVGDEVKGIGYWTGVGGDAGFHVSLIGVR